MLKAQKKEERRWTGRPKRRKIEVVKERWERRGEDGGQKKVCESVFLEATLRIFVPWKCWGAWLSLW